METRFWEHDEQLYSNLITELNDRNGEDYESDDKVGEDWIGGCISTFSD